MAKQVTIRRGTTAEHNNFAGAEGEITVDTDKDTVVVHDGVTDGGFPLALESAIPTTGTIATQDSDAVAITGGSVTGITDLTVADGGTGASDASTARSNLGSTTVGDAVFVATDEEVARAAMLVPNKNVIINGNFDIWQRGTIFADVSGNEYTADRWFFIGGGATATISRQAFTAGQTDVPGEPTFFLRMDVTVGDVDVRVLQRIEDVRTFAGETITVSFYAKSDTPITNFEVTSSQLFGSGGSGEVQLINSLADTTTSWQKYETSFNLASMSGKTIGAGSFLDMRFQNGTAGTQSLDIAQVQLEKGSVATEFEHRSQQQELAMAQRYYEKTFNQEITPAQNAGRQGVIVATGITDRTRFQWNYRVLKRIIPTVILFNPSAANNDARNSDDSTDTNANIDGSTKSPRFVNIFTDVDASDANNQMEIHATADAEL